MSGATNPAKYHNQVENFFIKRVVPTEYESAVKGIHEAEKPPVKKVYRNLTKMLEECYLIGSLKYGNNFIV